MWAYLSSGQFATVGDYNGDGKSDVAVRNAANGNWRVLASNGTAFTNSQWGNWTTSKAWSQGLRRPHLTRGTVSFDLDT